MKQKKHFSLFALAIAMLFVVGCGGSPKSAIENWSEAILEGNIEEANKYTATECHGINEFLILSLKSDSRDREEFKTDIEDLLDGEVDYDGGQKFYAGEAAFVEGEKTAMMVVKEDGKWKVFPVK